MVGDDSMNPARLITVRELDQALALPKGSAFRAFKARRSGWVEGRDYLRLDAHADRERIEALRRSGRIYPSSVHVVLLTPEAALQLRDDHGAQSA